MLLLKCPCFHQAHLNIVDTKHTQSWMTATPSHRGAGVGLPTVSPYSASSDGRAHQPAQPAHVVVPSPALT